VHWVGVLTLRERAVETLFGRWESPFLWKSFAIKNLACFSSGPEFDAILEKPLPGLQKVCRNVLGSASEMGGSEKVLDIIRNMALVLRPLTFCEFGHILAGWTKM